MIVHLFLGCSEIKTPKNYPLTKVSGLISDIGKMKPRKKDKNKKVEPIRINLLENTDKIHNYEMNNLQNDKFNSRINMIYCGIITAIVFSISLYFCLSTLVIIPGLYIFMSIIFLLIILFIPIQIFQLVYFYYTIKNIKKNIKYA